MPQLLKINVDWMGCQVEYTYNQLTQGYKVVEDGNMYFVPEKGLGWEDIEKFWATASLEVKNNYLVVSTPTETEAKKAKIGSPMKALNKLAKPEFKFASLQEMYDKGKRVRTKKGAAKSLGQPFAFAPITKTTNPQDFWIYNTKIQSGLDLSKHNQILTSNAEQLTAMKNQMDDQMEGLVAAKSFYDNLKPAQANSPASTPQQDKKPK